MNKFFNIVHDSNTAIRLMEPSILLTSCQKVNRISCPSEDKKASGGSVGCPVIGTEVSGIRFVQDYVRRFFSQRLRTGIRFTRSSSFMLKPLAALGTMLAISLASFFFALKHLWVRFFSCVCRHFITIKINENSVQASC